MIIVVETVKRADLPTHSDRSVDMGTCASRNRSLLIVLSNLEAQPCLRVRPDALRGSVGKSHGAGCLLHGHSYEIAQLDQFGSLRVLNRQQVQAVMNSQQFVI